MGQAPALTVRFWGVRGSIACPSPTHMGFGGNTSCVEVRAGERIVILDAGTGVRALGQRLRHEGSAQADFLFSHTHWDHVTGFPFFAPAFEPDHAFRVFAGHLSDAGGIREALAGHMHEPMFPVPLDVMRARLVFTDFRAGETLDLGPGLRARTAPLNHPNGATAYRIEHEGRSVCYVTDTEHVPGRPDENVLELIAGADLVIYDSTYTDAELPGAGGLGTLHLAGGPAPRPPGGSAAAGGLPPRPGPRRRGDGGHRARARRRVGRPPRGPGGAPARAVSRPALA